MDKVFGALQRDYQGDLLHQRQKIMKHLSALTTHVQLCNSIPALVAIESHLISACNAAKITETSNESFKSIEVAPANKKVTPQRPFYSTKSQKKKPAIRLAKPTE